MDRSLRELERRASQGDHEAAGELLFAYARSGLFWQGSQSDQNQRALWVRLLGWLRWPRAAEFHERVAAMVPPLPEPYRTHVYLGRREGVGVVAHAQLLGRTRPLAELGPRTVRAIGPDVMLALAAQACELVAPIAGFDPGRIQRAYAAARLRPRFGFVRFVSAEDLPQETRDLSIEVGDLRRSYFGSNWDLTLSERAMRTAVEAIHEWVGSLSGNWYSLYSTNHCLEAIFYATQALGYLCEVELFGPDRALAGHQRSARVARRGLDYGVAAGSLHPGCIRSANRRIKAAMLPAALLEIASQVRGKT